MSPPWLPYLQWCSLAMNLGGCFLTFRTMRKYDVMNAQARKNLVMVSRLKAVWEELIEQSRKGLE